MSLVTPRKGYKSVPWLFGKEIEIPQEWEVKNLDSLADVKGRIGWRGYTQDDFVEEGKGAISLGGMNIKNNKLNFKNRTYVTFEKYEESPEIQVKKNDILIQKTGSIGGIALINQNIGKATINPNVSVIKKIQSNSIFISYFLTNNSIKKQINRFKTATSVPLLTQEQIRSLILFIPSLLEQQKIASILSNVDNLIESTGKVITHSKKVKTGLMQKLLTRGIGHTKFKKVPWLFGKEIEIPEEWEVKCGNDICAEIIVGIVIKPASLYSETGVICLRSFNIREDKINEKDIVLISEKANEENFKSKLRHDDVLVVRTGYPGTACVVPEKFVGGNCVDLIIVRPQSSLDSIFLSKFINSSLAKIQIQKMQGGLAQQHFNVGEMKKIQIIFPTLAEQQKIALILSNIDAQITSQEQYKEKLLRLKTSLMQKLLTGEVRV
jgi:type I restriction enzyme, S subunit